MTPKPNRSSGRPRLAAVSAFALLPAIELFLVFGLLLVFGAASAQGAAKDAPQTCQLTSLRMDDDGRSFDLSLPVDASWKQSFLSNPPRIVIDLLETTSRLPGAPGLYEARLDRGVVRAVRTSQFRNDPGDHRTRVTLELSRVVPYDVRRAGNAIRVRIPDAGSSPPGSWTLDREGLKSGTAPAASATAAKGAPAASTADERAASATAAPAAEAETMRAESPRATGAVTARAADAEAVTDAGAETARSESSRVTGTVTARAADAEAVKDANAETAQSESPRATGAVTPHAESTQAAKAVSVRAESPRVAEAVSARAATIPSPAVPIPEAVPLHAGSAQDSLSQPGPNHPARTLLEALRAAVKMGTVEPVPGSRPDEPLDNAAPSSVIRHTGPDSVGSREQPAGASVSTAGTSEKTPDPSGSIGGSPVHSTSPADSAERSTDASKPAHGHEGRTPRAQQGSPASDPTAPGSHPAASKTEPAPAAGAAISESAAISRAMDAAESLSTEKKKPGSEPEPSEPLPPPNPDLARERGADRLVREIRRACLAEEPVRACSLAARARHFYGSTVSGGQACLLLRELYLIAGDRADADGVECAEVDPDTSMIPLPIFRWLIDRLQQASDLTEVDHLLRTWGRRYEPTEAFSDLHLSLAQGFLKAGQKGPAREHLDLIPPGDKLEPRALLLMAALDDGDGQTDKALELYERVTTLSDEPCRRRALARQADLEFQLGRTADALASYEKVLGASPPSDEEAWAVYQTGNCHFLLGDSAQARDRYETVGKRWPSSFWAPFARDRLEDLSWRDQQSGKATSGF